MRFRVPGRRYGLRGGLIVLSCLLVSCNSPEPPPSIPEAPESAVSVLSESRPESPPPESSDGDLGPLGHWVVAADLADLHETWTAFGCQSALGDTPAAALVPYADAVVHVGESWGLSEGPPTLFLMDPQGHAYRYPSGRHGLAPAKETREAVGVDILEEDGWQALKAGEELHLAYRGSTLHLLGALRATGACGQCHRDEGDRLLGAYLYVLHEIADD